MGTLFTLRVPLAAALLSLAVLVSATVARADIPMCDTIVQDPTVAACSCICEAGSSYTHCIGKSQGTRVPTPERCPDMLQGRNVLSRGDGLVLASPSPSPEFSDVIAAQTLVYAPENQGTTPPLSGLGMFAGHPWLPQYTDIDCQMPVGTGPFPAHAVFARLFDLPYDVVVKLLPTTNVKSDCFSNGGQDNMQMGATRRKNGGAQQVGPVYTWVTNPQWTQLAVGDFNYDGYDDLVFLNIDAIQVYTAVDPTDPGKGIERIGSANTRLSSGALRAPINTPVTGDFNGDGIMDVAWIGGNFPQQTGTLSVFFASICPGSVTDTLCEGKQPFQVILDPAHELFPNVSGATSTIALDNATLTPNACGVVESANTKSTSAVGSLRAGAIALGNFEDNGLNPRGAPVDELVITYVSGTNAPSGSADSCTVDAQYWSFSTPDSNNPVWAAQRGSTFSDLLGVYLTSNVTTFALYAQAAYLDWYGTTEQAILGLSAAEPPYASWWWPVIVSVNGSGEGAEVAACSGGEMGVTDGLPYAWGLAVGRFSTDSTVNPANPDACSDFASANPGDCPYNPQIAMMVQRDYRNGGGTGDPALYLYNVIASNPDSSDSRFKCRNDAGVQGYKPLANQNDVLTGEYGPFAVLHESLRGGNLLMAGDPFGNSVRLGPPTVARVSEHSAPQLVIGAPPSLVDFVKPDKQDYDPGTPAIVNFTRAPDSFQAQIQFSTSDEDTASTRETRSISSSTTETVSGEVKYKVPLIAQLDLNDKQSWTQFHESDHQQQLSTYSSTKLQTSGKIGADDQVWWTQTNFNVFNYPELGKTVCPASTTCDPGDPSCSGTLSGATLNCTQLQPGDSGYPGCLCQSEGASASLCPVVPSDTTSRNCNASADGSSACCTFLPQQLNVSFSGPQEVTRSSSPGATVEWYQPRHEPGQLLSYPFSTALIEARRQDAQELAGLSPFSIGPNTTFESSEWSCKTSSEVSTGTTTRHSFESDSSITFGTNKIAEQATGAAKLQLDFDYQHSDSFSTLNSYTVGQTAATSIALLLESTGFLYPDTYGYTVSGTVLGAYKPDSVLDNPDLKVCPSTNADCETSEEVQADCTTTGPITIAFAADPTAVGHGSWWESGSPYLYDIDVALNNPSRWRKVSKDQTLNDGLQCRGPETAPVCYDINQPTGTGATDVWGSQFYKMKGLFVTDGGTAGPMRNTATVGDEVYLQVRVYNYSLRDMDAGTRVYARFYRQQLDVNNNSGATSVLDYARDANGDALPAVPIGPAGLGDTTPVPVVGPDGVSNTIPKFNTTLDPLVDPAKDNIGLATASYTTVDNDICEYDNGVQSCEGAYYAYWVTVWAEDTDGNVVSELPGHGLGADFDPDTSYGFITDVPLEQATYTSSEDGRSKTESFTNNVGMFKMVFSFIPPETGGTFAAAVPRPLGLDRMTVSSDKALLGEPVVVSAQVVAGSAAAPGATVVFSDGDPQSGGKAFDAEWLPAIRANDRHYVSVSYNPETCGPHEIHAEVTGGSNLRPAEQFALVDVGIDYHSAVRYLIRLVERLAGDDAGFDGPWRKANAAAGQHPGNGFTAAQVRVLKNELVHAERALDAQHTDKAIDYLHQFTDRIARLEREGRIDKERVDSFIAQTEKIAGCVR